jgi:hypothetical protein
LQTAGKTVLLVAEVQLVVGIEGIVPLAYLDDVVYNNVIFTFPVKTDCISFPFNFK